MKRWNRSIRSVSVSYLKSRINIFPQPSTMKNAPVAKIILCSIAESTGGKQLSVNSFNNRTYFTSAPFSQTNQGIFSGVPSRLLAEGIRILSPVPKGWIHTTNWWVDPCQDIFGGIIKIPLREGNYVWYLRQNRHSIYKCNYFCYSIKRKNLVLRDTTEKIISVLTFTI